MRRADVFTGAAEEISEKVGEDIGDGFAGREWGKVLTLDLAATKYLWSEVQLEPWCSREKVSNLAKS